MKNANAKQTFHFSKNRRTRILCLFPNLSPKIHRHNGRHTRKKGEINRCVILLILPVFFSCRPNEKGKRQRLRNMGKSQHLRRQSTPSSLSSNSSFWTNFPLPLPCLLELFVACFPLCHHQQPNYWISHRLRGAKNSMEGQENNCLQMELFMK